MTGQDLTTMDWHSEQRDAQGATISQMLQGNLMGWRVEGCPRLSGERDEAS